MNTSLGYSKRTLTDSNVLLSGGGDKALSEFIGSLNWDSTNKKLQYKSASSTDFTDLITFGARAFDSTSYLPLSGGTMTGDIIMGANSIVFNNSTTSDWNVAVNTGIKLLNTVGESATGAPGLYHVGLSVSGYYGFQLAAYGGGGRLLFRNTKKAAYPSWEEIAYLSDIPTKSSWNYDDMYVSSLTTSGNSLRWIKNGSNNDITIPYANKASLDSNGRSLVTYKEYSGVFAPNDGTEQWYTILNYTNNYYSQSAILEINTRRGSAVILITFYNINSPYITCLSYYGSATAAGGGFTGKIRIIADGNNAIIQGAFYASTSTSVSTRYLGLKVYSEIPTYWVLPGTITVDTNTYDSFLANVVFTTLGFTAGHISTYADNTYNIGSATYKYKNIYATTFHGALDGNASTATNADNATYATSAGDADTLDSYHADSFKLKTSIWLPESKQTKQVFTTFLDASTTNLHNQANDEMNLFRFFSSDAEASTYSYPVVDSHSLVFSVDGNKNYIRALNLDVRTNDIYTIAKTNGTWGSWAKLLHTDNWTSVIDGRYLPLAGGTLTGQVTISTTSDLYFPTRTNNGTRASYYTVGNHMHGGEDNASYLGASIQIGTWYGFGIYPTISGQTRTQGQNSFWHNARTGNTYTWGDYYKFDGTNYTKVSYEGHDHNNNYVRTYYETDIDPATTQGYWHAMTQNSGITGNWWHIIHMDWHNGANWRSELALPTEHRNGVYYRSDKNDSGWNWSSWVKLLDADNYSSYALPLSGGTMTGLLTTTSGGHKGIKVGDTYITAIGGELILQNNGCIRFGTDDWSYSKWAGLKYDATNKIVYLGVADGTIFNQSPAAITDGKIYFPGVTNLWVGNGTYKIWHAGNDGTGSGLDADLLDGVPLANLESRYGVTRSWQRGFATSANQYFGNGNVVTIDPIGTGCLSANDTILSLGDLATRNTQLLVSHNSDGVWYRRITDALSYGSWKRLAFITDNVASATYATSAGTALVGNKLNVLATISSNNTANYPWRLIAKMGEITIDYVDTEAVIVLRQFCNGGKTGIIKIAFRTNQIATTASSVSAVWLTRYGFNVDDVKIAVYWVANKSYADVFLKATPWNRMEMHVIGNRSWSFVSSNEGTDGADPVNAYVSIEAAATALHGRAYTNIVTAIDGGIVRHANYAGSATQDGDGNTISSTYLKLSGGTLTGNLTISHTTNATMTAASTNPKITFAESGTQPVHLIYTDYDDYRSPAGLKVVGGTGASPAWFEAEGNMYSSGFVKNSSSDSYVLLGGGGHKAINNLQITGTASALNALDVTKTFIYATVSSNQTLGVSAAMTVGQVLTVLVYNSGSSSITVTVPTSDSWKSLDGLNLTIGAQKFGEISILCYTATVYMVSAKLQ